MIAYDLDGVIANTVVTWNTLSKFKKWIPKRLFWAVLRFASIFAPAKVKPDSGIIITGRSIGDYVVTKLWLRLHKINLPVYFCPSDEYDPELALKHKIATINTLKPSIYIESDLDIAITLYYLCPNTMICAWINNKAIPVENLVQNENSTI